MKLFKTALAPFVWLFLLLLSIIFLIALLFGKSTDGKSKLSSIRSFFGIKEPAPKQTTSNTVENPSGIDVKAKTYPVLYEVIEEIRYWYNLNEFIIPKGSLIYSYEAIRKDNPLKGENPSTFTQEQYNSADTDTSKWVDCLPVLLLPQMLIEIKMSSLKALTKDQAKDYFDNPKISSVDSEDKKLKIGQVYSVVINENFSCEVRSYDLDTIAIIPETLQVGQELFGTISLAIPNVFYASNVQFIDQNQEINMMVKVGNKTYNIPSSKIKIIKPTKSVAI